MTFLLLAKAADGAPERLPPARPARRPRAASTPSCSRELARGGRRVGAARRARARRARAFDEPRDRGASTRSAPPTHALGAADASGPRSSSPRPTAASATRCAALAGRHPSRRSAIDLVRGAVPDAARPRDRGVARGKTLVAGVIDGHNIWRGDLAPPSSALDGLPRSAPATVAVVTSTSLLHVPHDVDDEPALDAAPRSRGSRSPTRRSRRSRRSPAASPRAATRSQAELAEASAALADRAGAPGVRVPARARAARGPRPTADFDRARVRRARRRAGGALDLPTLPTTTIGSFPQTAEIRRARAACVRGELGRRRVHGR